MKMPGLTNLIQAILRYNSVDFLIQPGHLEMTAPSYYHSKGSDVKNTFEPHNLIDSVSLSFNLEFISTGFHSRTWDTDYEQVQLV